MLSVHTVYQRIGNDIRNKYLASASIRVMPHRYMSTWFSLYVFIEVYRTGSVMSLFSVSTFRVAGMTASFTRFGI